MPQSWVVKAFDAMRTDAWIGSGQLAVTEIIAMVRTIGMFVLACAQAVTLNMRDTQ